ncbi:MAG: hypothetical protein AB7K04_05445 [Pseudorhodoplanes sp.]
MRVVLPTEEDFATIEAAIAAGKVRFISEQARIEAARRAQARRLAEAGRKAQNE